MRKLKNGNRVSELKKPIDLKIHTKCPRKWKITDLETGQSYIGTGKKELYQQWEPVGIQPEERQISQIEKTVYRIEKDTIELRKKLNDHIVDVWEVYKPIRKIIEKFKLW